MNILLKPIYKLGDLLVKRSMEKWAKSPHLFGTTQCCPFYTFGEFPDSKSNYDTLFAIEDYMHPNKGDK